MVNCVKKNHFLKTPRLRVEEGLCQGFNWLINLETDTSQERMVFGPTFYCFMADLFHLTPLTGCCCSWNVSCIIKHDFIHRAHWCQFHRQSLFSWERFFESCVLGHWWYSRWFCSCSSLVCSTKLLSGIALICGVFFYFSVFFLWHAYAASSVITLSYTFSWTWEYFPVCFWFFYLNYLIPEWLMALTSAH